MLLGFRYRQVVTFRRRCITAIGFWILSIVASSTSFCLSLITSWYQYIGKAMCLVTTIFAYTKYFFSLHRNQIHVKNRVAPAQPSQPIPLNTPIQKGSVQYNVGAGNIGCLLSAVWYSSSFATSERDVSVRLLCFAIYGYFSVLELIIKPVAVLLDDQRSEASC